MRQSSRFEAATRRTSTRRAVLPPSGRTSPSWTTRRSFAWSGSGRSSISSRKSVPPSASRSAPGRDSSAPVNAPRACPKNSLSASDLGDRGAVDGNERRARPRTERVDGARDDLLAGAGLALDAARAPRSAPRCGRARARARIAGLAPTSPATATGSLGAAARAPALRRAQPTRSAEVRCAQHDVVGGARLHRRDRGGGLVALAHDDDGDAGRRARR